MLVQLPSRADDPAPECRRRKEVPFGGIDLFEIRVVADRLNSFLERNHLVVTGHHNYRTELQALRQMHKADRSIATCRLDVFVQHFESKHSILHR